MIAHFAKCFSRRADIIDQFVKFFVRRRSIISRSKQPEAPPTPQRKVTRPLRSYSERCANLEVSWSVLLKRNYHHDSKNDVIYSEIQIALGSLNLWDLWRQCTWKLKNGPERMAQWFKIAVETASLWVRIPLCTYLSSWTCDTTLVRCGKGFQGSERRLLNDSHLNSTKRFGKKTRL